jgi:hypothetical protein
MASVCCAAYDVLTDWHGINVSNRKLLAEIVTAVVGSGLAAIALELYDKEAAESVADDGLERGYDSIRFITGLLGSQHRIEKRFDLKRLGMALQVVDDVLDYEDDLSKGELNCLVFPRWREHLEFMEAELTGKQMGILYSQGWVFRVVVRHALQKARRLRRRKNLDEPSLPTPEGDFRCTTAASKALMQELPGCRHAARSSRHSLR